MVKLLATASEVPRAHTSSIRRSEPVRPARDRSWHLAALFSASLLLTACATPSTPGPIAEPAPKAVDARLCAKAEPEPPIAGGIVQPASDSERASTAEFLTSVSEALSWGRRGWERAKVAAKGC